MSSLRTKIGINQHKIVILLMITFFNLIESRPNGNPNSQSRNLITIIPGGISSSTRKMSTLPETSFLYSSPSEQYPQFRKRQFFRQPDQYAPSSSSYMNIETSNYGDSDSLHQDIPLYRDEGTSSFSKRYLVAESSSNSYPSSKGGYSQQPASQSYSGYSGQVIPGKLTCWTLIFHNLNNYFNCSCNSKQASSVLLRSSLNKWTSKADYHWSWGKQCAAEYFVQKVRRVCFELIRTFFLLQLQCLLKFEHKASSRRKSWNHPGDGITRWTALFEAPSDQTE